ncbi:MAG: T9SS type A sorting domain-containing protein, partial [Chitinophagaceae bacterium]
VLVIDKWTNASLFENSSTPISLSAGVLYAVRMEISGGTATLSWQSASQSKQIIPATALFPGAITSYANGYNLMEGIEYTKVLTDALYGWNRNAISNSYNNDQMYWTINCNNKTHIGENPDISIRFRNTSNYSVSRDMGLPNACITSWKVSGNINLEHNYPNIDNGEYGYFDILDAQGKIISRVTHEMYYSGNEKINQMKMNGVSIFTRNEKYLYDHLNNHQFFEISANNGTLTFGFADYNKISAGLFDKTADWTKPKTIRFSYYGNSYDRAIDLSQLIYTPVITAAPVISANGNIVFCQGDSVKLSSSAANTYLWSNSAKTSSIVVKSSGSYSVSTTNQYGCISNSNSILVNVNPLPQPIIKEGSAIAICQGDTARLSTINATSYLWSDNTIGQNTYITKAGVYSVKVTDINGCKGTSAPTTITVNQLPNATISADGATSFCQGKHITLSSTDAVEYLWSNGLTTKNIVVAQSGDYSVRITDANACKNTSNIINVNVAPFPKPIITASDVSEFCQGDSVTLNADNAAVYLWSTGETSSSITVKTSGSYSVATGDGNGCAAVSDPHPVKVNALPSPVISANENILSSNYSTGNQWYFNGNIIQGATQANLTVSETGLYSLKVINESSCEGYSDNYKYTVVSTGINKIKNPEISIVPNPNKGNFKIIHPSGRISIEVVNLLGEIIYSNSDSDGNIDLVFAAKGMYIVKIKTSDIVHFERIIVE